MDDHSDQSEITSSEEEYSDDSSPNNFTDDSQESESSCESNDSSDSSDSDDNQSLPQCWTTLIDEAMGRHEVEVESLMEEYEHQESCRLHEKLNFNFSQDVDIDGFDYVQ
ncbi:hypothetical protein QZH41_000237 [Actinostola sp. cb2023]|nr:hypothetical protein QZH41_000237 [Actinostola sp. cb2023]